jgi:hypothetical protein
MDTTTETTQQWYRSELRPALNALPPRFAPLASVRAGHADMAHGAVLLAEPLPADVARQIDLVPIEPPAREHVFRLAYLPEGQLLTAEGLVEAMEL